MLPRDPGIPRWDFWLKNCTFDKEPRLQERHILILNYRWSPALDHTNALSESSLFFSYFSPFNYVLGSVWGSICLLYNVSTIISHVLYFCLRSRFVKKFVSIYSLTFVFNISWKRGRHQLFYISHFVELKETSFRTTLVRCPKAQTELSILLTICHCCSDSPDFCLWSEHNYFQWDFCPQYLYFGGCIHPT